MPPVDPRSFAQAVENLRKSRLSPERDVTVAPLLRAAADEFRRGSRGLGNVGAAWADQCPAELAGSTRIESLHRGVLTVAVDDSAAKFLLDRWLRDGGEQAFIRTCGAPVRGVKLVAGDARDPHAGKPPKREGKKR